MCSGRAASWRENSPGIPDEYHHRHPGTGRDPVTR